MPRTDANYDNSTGITSRVKSFLTRRWGWLLGGLAILAACMVIRNINGPQDAGAQVPTGGNASRGVANNTAGTAPASSTNQLAALVNGQEITRQDLADECLSLFAKEVLEALVNKTLISDYCKRNNVVISSKDVDEEIEKMAKKFNLPPDQWLKMLQTERGINPTQYAKDVIWPTIALRRLAASELTVSPEELKDAYEAEYGPAMHCRMIVNENEQLIREAYQKATANPDDFPNLAKNYSTDVNVASSKGLVPPIRKNVGDPNLEKTAFALKEGQISQPILIDKQYIILKCEALIPPIKPQDINITRARLQDGIKEKKLRAAAANVFKSLQEKATIQNVYNDPAKRQSMPGVAATINDTRITMRELAEECLDRHGTEVIDSLVHRKLLEQALKQNSLQITQAHIDQEISATAAAMGKFTKDGQPDVQAWLKSVVEEQHATYDTYVRNAVWPSAALKLLVGKSVRITEEDLQKGYDANYGPRVRCRAIVFNNQRKAQEAWTLARDKRTPEYFGQLAEQYSIEASSRALQGKVPPIQRHGGQPLLEKEAFALQPGEISGIITVNDKFVILFCEGFTEPTKIRFEEVKDEIYEDLRDKKLRIAMNDQFDKLKESAVYDVYITGETHTPKKANNNNNNNVQPASGNTSGKGFVTPTSGSTPTAGRK